MAGKELIDSLESLNYYVTTGERKYLEELIRKIEDISKTYPDTCQGYLSSFFKSMIEFCINGESSKIDISKQEFEKFVEKLSIIDDHKKLLLASADRLVKGSFVHLKGVKESAQCAMKSVPESNADYSQLDDLCRGAETILISGDYLDQKLLKRLHVVNTERKEAMAKRKQRRVLQLEHDDHIRRSISIIFRFEEIDALEMAKKLRIHIKDIEDILYILKDEFLICEEGAKVSISSLGKFYCICRLGIRLKEFKASELSSQLKLNRKGLIRRLDAFINKLDPPNPYLSQWYFDADSILRIIEALDENFDLQGRSIVCLMCPTVAVGLALTNLTRELYVLDCDGSLLKSVENVTDRTLITRVYDIAKRVPDELKNKFDCFIIDPPYDENYYMLGVSRCIEMLGSRESQVNNYGKSGYVVLPPHEIAYVKSVGTPPLIMNLLSKLEWMGFFIEGMWPGHLSYRTPPFEACVLKKRLKKTRTIEGWRTSDLLKIRLFRNSASVFPAEYSLPNVFPNFGRFRRRFMEICSGDDSDTTYKPPSIDVQDADEWDAFLKSIDPPYCFALHDIGDWEKEANRMIYFKGPVSKYVWKLLEKKFGALTESDLEKLANDIHQRFSQSSSVKAIMEDIKIFLQKLVSVGVLNPEDIMSGEKTT